MKRPWVILLAGVAAALLGYFAFYFAGTAQCHAIARESEPELAWLKKEFHLNDAEFARISQMHASYLSGCMERCRLIDEKNQQLKGLLAATNTVTPEIDQLLSEAAKLRAECHKQMLQHFYEVSRTMPPEQGRRYLAWVQERTILPDSHQDMQDMHH
jgi:heavy-metal resistance protein